MSTLLRSGRRCLNLRRDAEYVNHDAAVRKQAVAERLLRADPRAGLHLLRLPEADRRDLLARDAVLREELLHGVGAALGSAERSPDGTEWITAPALPPRRVVARVVSASEVSVGTDAARWRRDGLLESSRQGFRARPALFDSVWEWFGEEEEPGEIRRSGTVEEEMAREGKGEAAR